jgi:hypothetical protein
VLITGPFWVLCALVTDMMLDARRETST